MIRIGEAIPKDALKPLYDMLSKITIRLVAASKSRSGFGKHRSMTFGLTKYRYKGRGLQMSAATKQYHDVHQAIFEVGQSFCPHPFTSVHLNHNVSCPPHIDGNNNGESTIISFGDYTGGNLVIENTIFNACLTPITFNGAELWHWNTDDLTGNKFSMVFFNMH